MFGSALLGNLESAGSSNETLSGIWIPSLIYPTFPPFLVDVRHNHSYLICQQASDGGKIDSIVRIDFDMFGFSRL
jgi:hypothetical protein